MDSVLFVGILLLNIVISIWNCYAVGTAWKDTMALGGWFNKLLLWSGVTQSGVGFSLPILLGLTWGATKILTGGAEATLTPGEVKELWQVIFNLWYLAVIFPVLGSGLAIWAHSLRVAYKRRDFGSIATASWNSYAQVSNTVSAARNVGGAFGNVKEFFGKAMGGKGEAKGKLALIVLLLVFLSIAGGFMMAYGLMKYFAARTEARIDQFSEDRFARA